LVCRWTVVDVAAGRPPLAGWILFDLPVADRVQDREITDDVLS
jgi:hypothetical protein